MSFVPSLMSEPKEPRYVKSTAASQVADSRIEDQNRIRNAFHPCSYTTIGSLPAHLGSELGAKSRAPALEGYPGPSGLRCGKAPAFFSEYEYVSDPFSLADELRSEERKQRLKHMQEIGNAKPFAAPGALYQAKYEGSFEYISEPYDAIKDDVLRRKWLEERKVVGGPFLPAGGPGPLEKPTRAMLTEMLTQLYRLLAEDWEEAQPTVFTTEEDLIVIYFNLDEIHNVEGIKSYMNVLVQRNESLAAYDLKRVIEGWGMQTEDNHFMFALRPPWVRPKKFGATNDSSTKGSASSGSLRTPLME